MITADQLFCHAVGDYALQSDWMAREKTKRWWPALVHGVVYSLAFLSLVPSVRAWAVIIGTHAIIDRLRLARFVVYAKNIVGAPKGDWHPWKECAGTGYHESRRPWMAVWLLIVVDNLMHVFINAAALRWLG